LDCASVTGSEAAKTVDKAGDAAGAAEPAAGALTAAPGKAAEARIGGASKAALAGG
jgi:hypothetical protein